DLLIGELARLHSHDPPARAARVSGDRSLAQNAARGGLRSGEERPAVPSIAAVAVAAAVPSVAAAMAATVPAVAAAVASVTSTNTVARASGASVTALPPPADDPGPLPLFANASVGPSPNTKTNVMIKIRRISSSLFLAPGQVCLAIPEGRICDA